MTTKRKAAIFRSSFTAVFAALLCLGTLLSKTPAYISGTGSAVPFTIQNMLAILAALILGGVQGAGATGLFLIAGIAGLPVFAGAKAGWETFTGPTGGYLWGYFLASAVTGLIAGSPQESEKKFSAAMWLRLSLASLAGFAIIYIPGILWYQHIVQPQSSTELFQSTLNPFISWDIIKWLSTIPLAALVRPVTAKYLYPNDEEELAELIAEMQKKKETLEKIKGKISKKQKRRP